MTKNESCGFWGILDQKAKSILKEDEEEHQQNIVVVSEPNPRIRKSIDKITMSLNQIGNSFEIEEGRTMVVFQIKRKGSDIMDSSDSVGSNSQWQPLMQPNAHASQLKASPDVAMATTAKANSSYAN
ncbi:hypothetical protein Bca52824_013844 [Brassica carinata]|uniref:Uncharacterized protein n=1 Tax=Brassica carinata TaxID=52824 RepID=A0A8X7VZ89_BRACI|nr:hypothetical protein Bca52824_013844 [Brassica carinata]